MEIRELIQDTSLLSDETLPMLREMVERYPFYQTARLLYVANLYSMHHPDFGTELRKASIFVPDRAALFWLTEGKHYQLEHVPALVSTIEVEDDSNRTLSLIDKFLSQSKSNDVSSGGHKPSLADVTTDYAAFLVADEDNDEAEKVPQLRGADLIDNFINSTKGRQRVEMQGLPDDYFTPDGMPLGEGLKPEEFRSPQISNEDEEIYTENMVNIYIRQGRYAQALEILRKICAANPEKNSNFAAQIKLLEEVTALKA